MDAYDPLTERNLNWGRWRSEDSTFMMQYGRTSLYNVLSSTDFNYRSSVNGSLDGINAIMCVREFRVKIFPESDFHNSPALREQQILEINMAPVRMTYTDAKQYCQELRTNCLSKPCSDNWSIVVPHKDAEEKYFHGLAPVFWTALSDEENAGIPHFGTIKKYDVSLFSDVYAIHTQSDDDIIWYDTSAGGESTETELPVICADYKFGLLYRDLQSNGFEFSHFHESMAGSISLVSAVEVAAEKAVETCQGLHSECDLLSTRTLQDYYDYGAKWAIDGQHLFWC